MSDERDERPRRSWAEIDRLRDKPRERSSERRPRGTAAEARSREATQQYLRKMDAQLFAKSGQGGSAGHRLAKAVRAALGSPDLAGACRRYLDEVGPPGDAALISAFLDAADREIQLAALRSLVDGLEGGRIEAGSGLRAQLRMLADGMDDDLAESAEEALEKLQTAS